MDVRPGTEETNEIMQRVIRACLSSIPIILVASALALPVAADQVSRTEAKQLDRETEPREPAVFSPAKPTRPPIQAIVYQPPRLGAPRDKVGGGTRGAQALPRPLALAPNHVAETIAARPSLFWHIDGVLSRQARVVLTVIDEESIDPIAEVTLAVPQTAGIQRIRLADYGVTLEPGQEYEWSIALVVDPAERANDIVSTASIRRVSKPSELAQGDGGGAATYAALGLWYDALESLSDSIEAGPASAATLRCQRDDLLRQAGLDAAVGC